MEKENKNDRISHVNVLWLLYRMLAEDIDISENRNDKNIGNDTEEKR